MALVERILLQMSNVSKPQLKFLLILFSSVFALRGRMNFRNLSRYSELSEQTYLRNFRKSFDFTMFNRMVINETIPTMNQKIGAADCSYIPKSGKESYGIDYFFSGQASRCLRGQEISLLSVIDVDYNMAYPLSVQQTPTSLEIGKGDESRLDFYLRQVALNQSHLQSLGVEEIAFDGYYAKTRFINGTEALGFGVISKLRRDANLRYLYTGPQKAGPGAKKKYDGKVYFDDLSRWDLAGELDKGVWLYSAILNSPHFKRNIKVVYVLDNRKPDKQRYALLFATNLMLEAMEIYRFYKARFQIEFVFRDAKQFTGLTDSQARKKEALHFHFNASLSALNVLRHQDRQSSDNQANVCSIASWKAKYFNEHLLDRFISYLDLDPILIKNHPRFNQIRSYGMISTKNC